MSKAGPRFTRRLLSSLDTGDGWPLAGSGRTTGPGGTLGVRLLLREVELVLVSVSGLAEELLPT